MEFAVRGADGKVISLAAKCCEVLGDPDRRNGYTENGKFKKREAARPNKFANRFYFPMHHGNTDSPQNSKVHLCTSKCIVESGFEKGPYNGIGAHYDFITWWRLGVGKVAARRIPCRCAGCIATLSKPWVEGVAPKDQPCFGKSHDCVLKDVLGDYNRWKILTVVPSTKTSTQKEFHDLYEEVLEEHEVLNMSKMQDGGFGAYDCVDKKTVGYYLVQWEGAPYRLKKPLKNFEGAVKGKKQKLPVGSWVCKGYYWNPIPGRACARWYTPSTKPQVKTFRIRYVVDPDVATDPVTPENQLPKRNDRARIERMHPVRVREGSHNGALSEIARRAMIDFEEEWTVNENEILGRDYDSTDDEHESDGEHDE